MFFIVEMLRPLVPGVMSSPGDHIVILGYDRSAIWMIED